MISAVFQVRCLYLQCNRQHIIAVTMEIDEGRQKIISLKDIDLVAYQNMVSAKENTCEVRVRNGLALKQV